MIKPLKDDKKHINMCQLKNSVKIPLESSGLSSNEMFPK